MCLAHNRERKIIKKENGGRLTFRFIVLPKRKNIVLWVFFLKKKKLNMSGINDVKMGLQYYICDQKHFADTKSN